MRKFAKVFNKSSRGSHGSTSATDWKGAAKVTWSGIEMLLKRAEKFLDGTPLKTPVGAINALITLFHQVSDGREDMRDMITHTWTRLQTIDTALMQSDPEYKITNERMDEFAKVLITQLSKLQLMASRGLVKRTLTSDDDIRALKRVFQDLEASTKDFHLAISLSIERNTAAILSDLKKLLLNSFPRSRQARYDADVDSEAVGVTRGACTPGTRVEIIQRLVEWARKQSSENSASIYWLNGSAGTGKSTIASSVCKSLDAEGILGASFFCSRQLVELRERKYIIPSIVYQLARYSRSFAAALLKADLDSADSSAKQMKDLLVESWQKSASDRLPNFPPCVVVVDALDEVQGSWEFLSELISTVKAGHLSGLKFLITSRREPKLVERCTALTSDFICHLEEVTRDNVQCDILTFLSAALPDLCGTPQLKDLAERAGGLFVYAATAVRFISRGYGSEQLRQLKSLLQAWPTLSDSVDVLPVDHLYSQVLQDVFGSVGETLRRSRLKILYTILCTEEPVSIEVLSGLICDSVCDVAFTGHVIEDLHAVLYVSKHDGCIFWYHTSFYDFMCDSERSLTYTCDTVTQQALLTRGCFTIMEHDLRFNICNLPSSFLIDSDVPDLAQRKEKFIMPLLRYVCCHWAQHLSRGSSGVTASCEQVESAILKLRAFCDGQLLFWIETMNIISQGSKCSTALRIAYEALKVPHAAEDKVASILLSNLKDAQNFAISFTSNALAVSTPHLYISTLAVYDGDSKLLHRWKKGFIGLPRLSGTRRREHLLTTIIKHTDTVNCASFSHDGQYIVSASNDKTVRMWNVETGKEELILKGHKHSVITALFSYNDQHIISASRDKTVRIWNIRTGKEELMLEGHKDWVTSASFSYDGKYIVSASRDKTVRVWNAETGKKKLVLNGHKYWVTSALFSHNDQHIISASHDKTVRIWNVKTGKEELMLEGHTGWVTSASFSHDDKYIVSASHDKTVRIWNAETGKTVLILKEHIYEVTSASFSYDDQCIVSASHDKMIYMWNAKTGKKELMLEGHTGWVTSASFSHDGQHIVSASVDKTVCVWNAETGKEELILEGHKHSVVTALFSHNDQHIISASHDKTVCMWNAETGKKELMLEGHIGWVTSASFSHNGKYIVSTSNSDKTVWVWNAETGKKELMLDGHTDWVTSASFSYDGQHIVSTSHDKTVRIWNVKTGKKKLMLNGHTGWVTSASFSHDGQHIVSASYDKTIRIWNVKTGKEKLRLEGHTAGVTSASFSHDDKHIISASRDKTVCMWNVEIGEEELRLKGHTNWVTSASFSYDGQHIVSASDDKTVRVWNVGTGQEELMLEGHTNWVTSASFSYNGQHIVSASHDKTVRIWNVETGHSKGHSHSIQASVSCDQLCFYNKTLSPAWSVQDEGWLVSQHQERLLWLPSTSITALRTPRCKRVISRLGDLTVDFSEACLGEKWAECYVGH